MIPKSRVRAALLLPLLGALLAPGAAAQDRRPRDVPYVPTPPAVVQAMLRTALVGPGDVVYDLGSGDGRIVIAAARDFGARGLGVEIDPRLVAEATENARLAGVGDRVRFAVQDLFETDLRQATVVTLYLLPSLNLRLRPVLLGLPPGTRIVSHEFDMEEWEPDVEMEVEGRRVLHWVVPAPVEGSWEWTLPGSPARPYRATLRQVFQHLSGESVQDGSVAGERVGFTLVEDGVRMRYQGTARGRRIEGTVEVDSGPLRGTHPWSATLVDGG